MLKFQAQVYRINDVLGWHDRRELVLAPDFQRRKVWTPRGRSFLIDSVIKGMPLPQFFIREVVLPRERRTVREVVDGQQRLSAILDFLAGNFTMLPMHSDEYGRVPFERLPEAIQREVLSFPLSVNILEGVSDSDVLAIFSRLNSYSMPLNKQEKLNALYVGAFKKSMAELAQTHLQYWVRHDILSKQPIARMRDVEFTSELVAAMLLGLQNQKAVIAELYKKYDDEFSQANFVVPRFAEILGFCEQVLGGNVSATEFRRTSLFYSLFAAAYDCRYGFRSDANSIAHGISPAGLLTAQQRLIELSEAMAGDVRSPEFEEFYAATRQSTDKIAQRRVRHDLLQQILAPCFI